MSSSLYQQIDVDVLVIGGGGAAVRAAIAAKENGSNVVIVCKGIVGRSGATPMACPSYQAAFAHQDPRDNPETAFFDTVEEGRYLGDEDLIWALTQEATERAQDLENYGLKYEMADGHWFQVQHPGHSYARNLVIKGCGYAMNISLKKQAKKQEVPLFEDCMATKLLKDASGRVVGAVVLSMRDHRFLVFRAKAVVLASGGYPELWEFTDTSRDLTGDGQAIAYRAGAKLVDMEMMLYYPTCLKWPNEIEGTLVQHEGLINPKYVAAPFINGKKEPFMPAGLPPCRDELMKIMVSEVKKGNGTPNGGVYIAVPESPKSKEDVFKLLKTLDSLPYHNLKDLGIDISQHYLEVMPGTHFTLGGVKINPQCETNLVGLYAAGEAAGNIHGANRTSGNALSETQVFGKRAGDNAAKFASQIEFGHIDDVQVDAEVKRLTAFLKKSTGKYRPNEIKKKIQKVMHEHMGYQRDAAGMIAGLEELRMIQTNDLPEVYVNTTNHFDYEWMEAIEIESMVELAQVVITSGLTRQETRGHHWRTDFPETREEWCKHIIAARGVNGEIELSEAPVVRIGVKVKTKAERL